MEAAISTDIRITSPAFGQEGMIPEKYTCDGQKINPPLIISNIPAGTRSLALIVDDPDAPQGTFTHWLVWNIEPIEMIEEDCIPGIEGINSSGKKGYTGPCPPSGMHHYHFKVYALNEKLSLNTEAVKEMLLEAMKGHILGTGQLIGVYSRVGES